MRLGAHALRRVRHVVAVDLAVGSTGREQAAVDQIEVETAHGAAALVRRFDALSTDVCSAWLWIVEPAKLRWSAESSSDIDALAAVEHLDRVEQMHLA